MKRHWRWLSPLFLSGCAAVLPLKTVKPVDLLVYPRVSPHAQAIVSPYSLTSIATLSLIPHIETVPGSYAPISALTGNPTTPGAGDVLALHQVAPGIDPSLPFTFRRLKPNTKYRILARAYDASNVSISKDSSSYVDIELTNNDAPGMTTIPVALVARPFGATTSITLNTEGRFDYLKATLYLVAGNAQVGLMTTSRKNPEFTFGNLQGDTNYRLSVEAYKLGSLMATQSLTLGIGNDDRPATQSMSLTVPYIVSTLAGSTAGFAEGVGSAARFNRPIGVAVDAAGNLFVSDSNNRCIRKVTPAGEVSTFAGSTKGYADGTGTSAQFFDFYGSGVFDAAGNLYVADSSNQRIRKITPSGVVSTVAGSTQGTADGVGTSAQFSSPYGIAMDSNDNLYVADTYAHRIRKVTSGGVVSTLAGSGSTGTADGNGTSASFYYPEGIAVDASGNVYVVDCYNHRIRKVTPQGEVSTLAGSSGSYGDGTGTSAKFKYPRHLAIDGAGMLYVSDENNSRIRKVTPNGVVTTLAGNNSTGSVDATGTSATLYQPWGLAVDGMGKIYVADTYNNRIRVLQ